MAPRVTENDWLRLRIRRLIREEGLRQREFADLIGMSVNSVSAILNGRYVPSSSFVQRVKAAFPGLDVNELFVDGDPRDGARHLASDGGDPGVDQGDPDDWAFLDRGGDPAAAFARLGFPQVLGAINVVRVTSAAEWLARLHVIAAIEGDAMDPTLADGDLVFAERLEDTREFIPGRVYLVDAEASGIVARRLRRPGGQADAVELLDDAGVIGPVTIAMDEVRTLHQVTGRLTRRRLL